MPNAAPPPTAPPNTSAATPATLADLAVGQAATVAVVEGEPTLVQRLLEMGVLDGEPVVVLGVAPLGDPIRVGLRDYQLSLRRREAACVRVENVHSSRSV